MHPKPKKKKRVVKEKKTTIVVGNLPDTYIGIDLHNLFSNYGEVTDWDVINKYGFVRMETPGQVQRAVEKLSSKKLNAYAINVECMETPEQVQRALEKLNNKKLYDYLISVQKTMIFVGNLPDTYVEADLHNLFSNHGEVTGCAVFNKYGFVRMETPEHVQTAVEQINNKKLYDYPMNVEIAKSKRVTGAKPSPKAPPSIFNSNLQKFAFHKLVMHLISRPNIAACLSVIPRYNDYEKEFEKFLDFVENLEGLAKFQLARAIFPLFVHFYLNVVDERKNADTFYYKFVEIFHSSKDYKEVLKELYEIKNRADIEEHPYFNNFRIRKYVLRISPSALKMLQSFLKDIKSIALSQIFSLFFYYEDSDVELFSDAVSRKKAKKPKHSNRVTQLNYEKFYSIFSKKKKPTAEDQNVTKTHKSESSTPVDASSFEQLLAKKTDVAEFDPPILRTEVDWFESDIYAMDFNQDMTELCITFGDRSIFISSLAEKYISLKLKELMKKEFTEIFPTVKSDDDDDDDDDSDDDSDEEEGRSGKKVFFSAPVRAVKYFPNWPYLLLAASGTEITKVNTAADTITPFGSGHIGEIWDIDINSTGSLFSSASQDMTCRLGNISKSSILRIYAGHKNIVTTVKFHPNGIYLLSGSKDYDIRLWNIENGMCLRCLVDHKAPVTLVTCSPDKKTIASADSNGIVKLWDIEENQRIFDIQCFKDNKYDGSKITSMCFADENFLGLCNSRGIVKIWDIRKPESVFKKTYANHIPVLLKASHLRTWSVIIRKRGEDMEYYDNTS